MQMKVGNDARKWGRVAAGTALSVGLSVVAMTMPARAAGPLPYDGPAPPPNVSVAFMYNIFSSASNFYTSNGTKIGNTRIQTDVPIIRFAHTFTPIHGMVWGLQVIQPYVTFLGGQEVGGAGLSHNSGFAEPLLSGFIYPVNNPKQNEALVLAYFLSPPTGAYNSNVALNASTNNWVNNIEVGYTRRVFGTAKGKRLEIELWADGYFYGDNTASATKLRTDPAAQFIVYAPYYFYPQKGSYVGLSFEKTFGGKVTAISSNGASIDTGSRNNFTRVGIIAGSFITPTVFAQGELSTDVQARGGARNDVVFQVQVGKVF